MSRGHAAAARRLARSRELAREAERRLAFATQDAYELERRAAAAKLELARALHHARRASGTRPKTHIGANHPDHEAALSFGRSAIDALARSNDMSAFTDMPAELAENSDGVSDDGAIRSAIIGACACDGVAGLPWYALTRGSVTPAEARRRFLAALSKLPPKMRRRVVTRLRAVARSRAAVAGIRSVTPSVGRGWSAVGKCPYANVAGPLTP